jgi:hypothetical protein
MGKVSVEGVWDKHPMRVEKEAWPSVPDSLDPVVHELIGH